MSRGEGIVRRGGGLVGRRTSDNVAKATAANAVHVNGLIVAGRLANPMLRVYKTSQLEIGEGVF